MTAPAPGSPEWARLVSASKARLMNHVSVDASGCWLWTGYVNNRTGYGQAWFNGTNQLAHRVMYAVHRGQVPAGLTLDHLCRIRACVNPDHLEPVTQAENNLRAPTITTTNTRKTHCPQGHEYDAANTYIDKRGKRYCRACKAERQRSPEGRAYWNAWYAENRRRAS